MTGKYIISDYFQKSKHFLFPLITSKQQEGLISTYLFADYLKEDIIDYYLICEIERNTDLNEDLEKLLYTSYDTVENTEVHIFDLTFVSEEVNKFLAGAYSQYTIESKNKILQYYKWSTDVDAIKERHAADNTQLHFFVILFPEKFRDEYTTDLFNAKIGGKSLFSSARDVHDVVRGMKELGAIYDLDKETFKKEIKNK